MANVFRLVIRILILAVMIATPAFGKTLVIAGTGDSQVILRKLAALYEKNHRGSKVVVPDSVGSGGGVTAVLQGTADLGRTARPLKAKEANHGLIQIPFAMSPVVFVANPNDTNVLNVTSENVVRIYSGAIRNWKILGGDDHKIYVVDREHGDSSRKILEKKMATSTAAFQDVQSVGKVIYTTPDTARAIAQNRYTFGFMPLSTAREARLHEFALDSVVADKANVQSGRYPLVTTLYLIQPQRSCPLAQDFLSFIQTHEARDAMLSSGVIPVVKSSE